MARFMERFERHMRDDPALRAEYERLKPRFRALSGRLRAQASLADVQHGDCAGHSGSQ